jgi:hypothetical protein
MNELARLLPGYKKLSEGDDTHSSSDSGINDSERELFDVVSLILDNSNEKHVCFHNQLFFYFFSFFHRIKLKIS